MPSFEVDYVGGCCWAVISPVVGQSVDCVSYCFIRMSKLRNISQPVSNPMQATAKDVPRIPFQSIDVYEGR